MTTANQCQLRKIKILSRVLATIVVVTLTLGAPRLAMAADTNVAVAANFTEPVKEIAELFTQKTGHKAILSFGATGQFYAQITHGAPFQVLLSADQATPKKLAGEGFALGDSQFTYAVGKLVLFSMDPNRVSHHLAGLADIAQLLGQFQHSDLGPDYLLVLRHGVGSCAAASGAARARHIG